MHGNMNKTVRYLYIYFKKLVYTVVRIESGEPEKRLIGYHF